jgi:hypothetical protein
MSQVEGTSTDLLFEYLADPSKLKPDEKVLNIPNRIDERSEDSDFRTESTRSSKSSRSSKRSTSSQKGGATQIQHLQSNYIPIFNPTPAVPPPVHHAQPPPPPVHHAQPPPPPVHHAQPPPPQERFPSTYIPSYNPADEKSIKFRKMELLAKLYDIKKTGRQLTREYNINSEIEDMEMEVRYQTELENKRHAVDMAKGFLCHTVRALEFMNNRFDPFGLQLDGWSDQMKMNIDNYNDVMAELYEKYKNSGRKVEPEIKLLFMILVSAGGVHASKTMSKKIGLESVVKNNPELMQKIQGKLTGSLEKKIGKGEVKEAPRDPMDIQREMYRKMMEEKSKKPQVSNILDKLKNKIPINVDTSKLEETSATETPKFGRMKVTKTIDSESDVTTTEVNVNKTRKNRPKLGI